jgi:DnaK suppressor protein
MSAGRTNASPSVAVATQQRDLQNLLRDRRREVHEALRGRVRRTPFAEGADSGLDETEHAEAHVQEDIEVALIQMKRDTIRQVEASLVRLEAGHYGHCSECRAEIPQSRLRAVPFALRCRTCEESREQLAAEERRAAASPGFTWR